MKNIRLTIQYDGTEYSGWQVQKKESTIQGSLEDSVFAVTGEELRVSGAGRTDAGVHAFQQIAVFHTQATLEAETFQRALNAHLPHDIRIVDAVECPEEFHPRFRAKSKTYCYLISQTGVSSLFLKRYSWEMPYLLNSDSMRAAAQHLIGKHDYSSFRASGCSAKSPVREIMNIGIRDSESIDFMTFAANTRVIRISIQANAFLRHMARNIVGTLVDVGRGKVPPVKMKEIREARNRKAAGITAPACGLFLEKIEY